jgi:hypothetical protein
MTDEKNIDEKVKELLARPIESMSDARAIVHVGQIVDLGGDLHSSDITEKAIQLLDAFGTRSLSEVHEVLRLYFMSNACATRVALAAEGSCRFQYSLSFISALMSREANKQLPTRHLSGEKTQFRSLCGFQTPRMATSTIDKTHACDNHS